MKNRILKSIVLFSVFSVFSVVSRAEVWSDTTFVGSVYTGCYSAISGLTIATTNGGYWTNTAVTYTNYYRLSGTNVAGRLPLSTNLAIVWKPGTGTNAVKITWLRPGGVNRTVIEKSYDAGATWTNWLDVTPGTTNWSDTGSNTWTGTIFTNVSTPIPSPLYPWGTTQDVTSLQAQITSNDSDIATLNTGKFSLAAWQSGSNALHVVDTNMQAQYDGHTNTIITGAHPGAGSASTNNTADFSASVHTHAWTAITNPPTTASGYGITDAATNGVLNGTNGLTWTIGTNQYWILEEP
jgi:hypothetical protein